VKLSEVTSTQQATKQALWKLATTMAGRGRGQSRGQFGQETFESRHFESFLSVDQSSTAHRLTSGPWKQPTKEQLDSWAPPALVERDWRETPSLADLVLAEREADEKWFAEIKPVKPAFPIKILEAKSKTIQCGTLPEVKMTRTEAIVGVDMAARGEQCGGEVLSNTQVRDNGSSPNTQMESTGSSQPVHGKNAVSKSSEGDDGPWTVKVFSCWCEANFMTMSSYAKHVNLHARGEYKPERSEEEKQEEETSKVLVSNETERRAGKKSTLVQKKESVRGEVGMNQKLEAAVKQMNLVSKTSTTSKLAFQTRVSSNSSDTYMTAKSRQESD